MSQGGSSGGGQSQMFSQAGATIGDIAGYHIGRRKGSDAANAMLRAQNEANALYRQLYGETQADYQPYQEAGTTALDALMRSYGLGEGQTAPDYSGYENSPDYLFAREQGEAGANRLAASRGRLYSGAQAKGLSQFNQGLATQYLGNYRSGLQGLSGQGLGATNALANYRAGYGNQLGTGLTNIGDIHAGRLLGESALHNRFNQNQKDVWGVGSGGGNQQQNPYNFGGGQSSYNYSSTPMMNSLGSGSYDIGQQSGWNSPGAWGG